MQEEQPDGDLGGVESGGGKKARKGNKKNSSLRRQTEKDSEIR